jgi:dTMP kinase
VSGQFITVEGGEGVGKSLFIQNLALELTKYSIKTETSREPGGTPIADKLRSLFNTPPSEESFLVETEFLIVSAARAQHTKNKLIPCLNNQTWVICDRYADSSRVYQGFVGGLDTDFIENVISKTTFGLSPNMTFVLDCPVEISMKRINSREKNNATQDGATRYDDAQQKVHEQFRQGFASLAESFPSRVFVLDSSQSPENVLEQALSCLRKKYPDQFSSHRGHADAT